MAPPTFAELGRPAAGIFTKGYPLGVFRVDSYLETLGKATLTTGAAIKLNEWSMDTAELNNAYTLSPSWLNTTICQSWDLENNLRLGITTNDLAGYVPGLRFAATGTVDPATGKSSGRLFPRFKTKYLTMDASIEAGDEKKTMATGSVVAGCGGWFAGAKGNYNMDQGALDSHTLTIAKQSKTFEFNLFWDDMERIRTSFFHRIGDRVEAGLKMSWKPGTPPEKVNGESGPLKPIEETGCEIAVGATMLLTPYTSLHTKVNTDSNIGIGIESEIRNGVVLTMAVGLDGKNLTEGKHKIGFGLDFDGCNSC